LLALPLAGEARGEGRHLRPLSTNEARVLAVLVEKQATVPDTYPLSLNALVAGCNQKTAREPVLELTDGEVLEALDGLKSLSLVFEVSGSRVLRFEHNMGRVLGVPSQAVALLATLMLRGPQTAAELRLNADRLHHFADISSVEAFLDELAAKPMPFAAKLARAPGARESRWVHRLTEGGRDSHAAPSVPAEAARPAAPPAPSGLPPPARGDLRFSVPAEKKFTHQLVIPVRWGDMDAMGHVNNTVYFRYIESARLEWLFAIGAAVDPRAATGEGPLIINAFCNFLRPVEYPGDLLARHYVANPGRSSFDTYVTLERTDQPGVLYAEGGSKTVWTDYRSNKSAPLPDWMRKHLE
jgi:uncharacterized protein